MKKETVRWEIAPTLLEGKPDEEPWISASWLD
jgi:hypothetical protein